MSAVDIELEKKWTPKKEQSLLLSDSYFRLDWISKAERVSDCGSWLDFVERSELGQGGAPRGDALQGTPGGDPARLPSFKLYHANFCRDRLCPMCSWRRSYKIFGQVSQIMDLLGNNYRYIFLTLTVPNCEPEGLNKLIDDMVKAWHRFINRKAVKTAVKGFFRALEVTRNKKTGTYHPHFHVVLAVNPSYFTSRDYIQRDEWLQLWQQSMKDETITQVDVRTMKNKRTGEISEKALATAVAEAAKYAVKSSDYIFKNNDKLMDKIVFTLSSALAHRRLTAFGGCFAEAREKLGLDDCEDGDLIHIDDNNMRSDLATMIYHYEWSCGAYKLVKKTQLEIIDGVSVNPDTGEIIK